jgi:hypothetical protein
MGTDGLLRVAAARIATTLTEILNPALQNYATEKITIVMGE